MTMEFMQRAVDLGRLGRDEHEGRASPRVGAVVVRAGHVIAESHRGQFDPGDHAEFCALEKTLAGQDLSGATVYTTLEPCSSRNHPKVPCAVRLVERRVSEVVIGIYDPDPRVNRRGWKILDDAGVQLRDFPEPLRAQIKSDNTAFLAKYIERRARTGDDVLFDYTQNNGQFRLGEEGHVVDTKWSTAGSGSIHAYDDKHHVALARYARSFGKIDDPSALDFSSRSVTARTGEIVVFRNGRGDFALVQVGAVQAGPRHRDEYTSLGFSFEVRTMGE